MMPPLQFAFVAQLDPLPAQAALYRLREALKPADGVVELDEATLAGKEWRNLRNAALRVRRLVQVNLGDEEIGATVRTALLCVEPGTATPWRALPQPKVPRYHLDLPLATNPMVAFICGASMQHMEAGSVWGANRHALHSLANFGVTAAIHLLVEIERPHAAA